MRMLLPLVACLVLMQGCAQISLQPKDAQQQPVSDAASQGEQAQEAAGDSGRDRFRLLRSQSQTGFLAGSVHVISVDPGLYELLFNDTADAESYAQAASQNDTYALQSLEQGGRMTRLSAGTKVVVLADQDQETACGILIPVRVKEGYYRGRQGWISIKKLR